jgi:hypothetical protein
MPAFHDPCINLTLPLLPPLLLLLLLLQGLCHWRAAHSD